MAAKPKKQSKPKSAPTSPEARSRVLANWRGIDLDPIAIGQETSAKSAATVMPAVLKSLGLDRRRLDAEVGKVWNNLLDPTLVAHAQPKGLHKGTLFVNVDSSVWLHEIVRYRREEILQRMQHSFGSEFIQKISFRIG